MPRRFFQHSPLNIVASALTLVILIAAMFGDRFAPFPPNKQNLSQRLKPPSLAGLMGTDDFGRDVFSRVIHGTPISLRVAAIVLSIALVIGVLVGAFAGLLGGWVDAALMRFADLFLAFPALIFASAISVSLGGVFDPLTNASIALSAVYWPWYARLMRSQVMALAQQEFVTAARAMGMSAPNIILRHMLRNALPLLLVQVSLDIGYAILFTSSLSFLGLGAQRPLPEWGLMLNDSRKFVQTAPWTMIFPGLALTITVLTFNLLGDGLRDYLDPRMRGGKR
jgi:peptide/nickel transport system permease protein